MKFAIITNDEHLSSLSHVDPSQLMSTISNTNKNICILDYYPDSNVSSQLVQEGFKIILLSDLIRQASAVTIPNFSDIMNREENPISSVDLTNFYKGKTVFVTGGEGFIGSEIVDNLLRLSIEKVIVYGHGENSASTLCKKYHQDKRFEFILGDIRDKHKLFKSIKNSHPNIVFHAAAHKHVPVLELYPEEAIKTNVIGTVNTIEAAIAASVEHFVLVSTDKAVNPISALGASKRIAEKICLAMDEFVPNMHITTVRFGNVFGSVGSVVPIFLDQIAHNTPLTITDPLMLRYFMSVNEAARLVLLAVTTEEGNLFSFDMGDSISIGKLAQRLVEYIGFKFDIKDVSIIGNRGGEKDAEELTYVFEQILTSKHEKLFALRNTEQSWTQDQVKEVCETLSHVMVHGSCDEILESLQKYIP